MIESEQQGDQLVVSLFGELALDNATMLRDQVLTAPPGTRTTIVLRGLDWIDSAGLRLLLKAQQRALASDHRICLKIGPRQVDCVLAANLGAPAKAIKVGSAGGPAVPRRCA